jgi:hypothetical protein
MEILGLLTRQNFALGPFHWKKSMLEGGSWILFLFLTITPQPKVVNQKSKMGFEYFILLLVFPIFFWGEISWLGPHKLHKDVQPST